MSRVLNGNLIVLKWQNIHIISREERERKRRREREKQSNRERK